MNGRKSRLAALGLCLAALLGLATVSAAALEPSKVTVELRPSVRILVDGTERTFYDVAGKEVHPIYYNGTHYLPVRAIGELMGKNVNWDGSTRTITLSGPRTATPATGTPDTGAKDGSVTVEQRPDISIVVDGTKRTFTDAKGNPVYVLLNSGTNYLPVRAIGELMGKTVSWDGQTRTITLSGGAPLVTDADTFGPSGGAAVPPATGTNPGTLIGEEAARSAVLSHAKLTAAQVTPHCPALEQATKVKFTCTDTPDGVKIHALGKNAHASLPEGGINAIQGLLDLLYLLPLADCPSTQALRSMHELFPFGDMWGKSLGIAMADESGKLTLNLGLMTLTGTGFTASFDSRVPVCATEDNCAKVCRAAMAAKGIAVTDSHMMAAHIVEADSPLVKTLLECYSTYTGVTDPQPIAIGGGTYVHNIPGGVAFGCEFPDFDPKMHSANEQARVEDLMTSAKIFALAIAKLCI